MNHIIWRFGFYDKESELAQSVKKSCSRIYSHKEDGDNWLFLNDEQAVKTADRYAEAVVEYIFVKLGMKPPERKVLKKDIKIKPDQLENKNKEKVKTWLNTYICGKTGNIDESKMADRLNLLIRGHYLELKEDKLLDNLMKNQSLVLEVHEILKKVFNYEYFSDTAKKYRSDLLSATKITVCPYCDRQYISYYSGNKTTADLDHFWDKSDYPCFALSLFNFIPSCHTCNSTFKGTKELKVYPYRNGFENSTHFVLEPGRKIKIGDFFTRVVIGSYKGGITVKQYVNDNVSDSRKDEIENDISVLKLNDLYTEHGDYVRELLTVKHLYEDEDYIRQVNDILKNSLKKDGMNVNFPYPITKEGVRAFLIGDTDGDESGRGDNSLLPQKRPLATLTSAVMSDEHSILTNSVNKK